jgi:hypothetical protein
MKRCVALDMPRNGSFYGILSPTQFYKEHKNVHMLGLCFCLLVMQNN